MKHNNKGFTFVELIVGIVIFGLITAAAMGFLVTASKTYSSVNSSLSQRLETQLVLNQIEEYLIDCNGSLSFSTADKTLRIANIDGGNEMVYVFKLSDSQLLFGSGNAQNATAVVADGVTDFSVELGASRAVITLSTEMRGRVLKESRTVAFRNEPKIVNAG